MTARRLARVALATERDSNFVMRKLLADLDRQLRILNRNKGQLDKASARQLDKVLKLQSQTWSQLAEILANNREMARAAANRTATEAERHFIERLRLDPATKRRLISGPDFSRSRNAAVAQRVSASKDFARRLLVRNLNRRTSSGTELATTVKSQLSPRTKGGVSYVAKRLVRTEIAFAYHQAQIERAAATPWVKGLKWTLSPDHNHTDICDIYARRGTYDVDGVPDIPHPNCMCTLKPVLMTDAEFTSALEAGLFNRYLGRSFPETAGNAELR